MTPTEPVRKKYTCTETEIIYYDDITDMTQQLKKAAEEKRYDLNRAQRRALKKANK